MVPAAAVRVNRSMVATASVMLIRGRISASRRMRQVTREDLESEGRNRS